MAHNHFNPVYDRPVYSGPGCDVAGADNVSVLRKSAHLMHHTNSTQQTDNNVLGPNDARPFQQRRASAAYVHRPMAPAAKREHVLDGIGATSVHRNDMVHAKHPVTAAHGTTLCGGTRLVSCFLLASRSSGFFWNSETIDISQGEIRSARFGRGVVSDDLTALHQPVHSRSRDAELSRGRTECDELRHHETMHAASKSPAQPDRAVPPRPEGRASPPLQACEVFK